MAFRFVHPSWRKNNQSFLKNSTSPSGFTLFEVLIVLFIITFITIAVYQATKQTFRLRDKILTEGDFYNNIRLAMGLMEQDVSSVFNPLLMKPIDLSLFSNTKKSTNKNPAGNANSSQNPSQTAAVDPKLEELLRSPLGQPADYWLGVRDLTAIRPSRFYATSEELRFVSNNHIRLYKDSPESIYAKIRYYLEPDREKDAAPNTRVLSRTENTNAFDDVEKKEDFAKTHILIRGIRSLKFRFYRKDKKQWLTEWDSNQQRDLQTPLYPDLIEGKIEVVHTNNILTFEGVYYFKPETPQNGIGTTY